MPKLDKEVSQKLRLAHSNLSIRKRASSRCSPEPPASRPASRVSVARTSSAAPVATPAAPPPPLSARAVNGTTPRASPTPRAAAPPLPSRSLPVNKALQQPAEGDDDFEDLDVWIHSQYYAAGGQKKKALEALSGDMDGLSIHQVQEVSKISSGSARCDVKIEFYRDHYHLSDPLQRYVEKAFMCAHHRTGETIVDVAKLRKSGRGYTRLVKEREQNEAGEDGEEAEIKRPISQQTTRSNVMARSRPPTVVTPEMTMSSLRQHALERDRRIDRTVARAREMQIAKRLQQLAKWQSAQSRHARAERERPWLRVAALASVLQIMAKSLSVFHHIKHTVHGKVNHAYDMKVLAWESGCTAEASLASTSSSRISWRPLRTLLQR
eukprot:TRINITY_DN25941_c0_g1_i1.p1 TRINITY_DN25941_c0_g1~~TRINITY_DN25941_c0_g1_i1.p1  ORF type:complete len:380 (+),score=62.04 TRINITY_DN25941_c0_g1_i1:102-1241(+)